MSYFNTKKEFSLRDLLYRALIFIGTVGIIVYFLPRDGKFNYQFDIDKPGSTDSSWPPSTSPSIRPMKW